MQKRKLSVRDLPKTKQPRERLVLLGVANLTAIELLAIILGSGTKKQNVLNLAKKILHKFPLKDLVSTKISDLARIEGVGRVQASKILASLELGRRAIEGFPTKRLLTPEDVLREVDDIRDKSREYLIALYLNARRELIKKQAITIGGLNQNIVEPRDVFNEALTLPCAFVILVHNHPSGDPSPSEDDKTVSKKLAAAGQLLGISIIDHIIVAKKEYFSFREAELI